MTIERQALGGAFKVNGRNLPNNEVIKADINATNGVVHVRRPLMPTPPRQRRSLSFAGRLNSHAAVKMQVIDDVLLPPSIVKKLAG